jgi:hypothetical protein
MDVSALVANVAIRIGICPIDAKETGYRRIQLRTPMPEAFVLTNLAAKCDVANLYWRSLLLVCLK